MAVKMIMIMHPLNVAGDRVGESGQDAGEHAAFPAGSGAVHAQALLMCVSL